MRAGSNLCVENNSIRKTSLCVRGEIYVWRIIQASQEKSWYQILCMQTGSTSSPQQARDDGRQIPGAAEGWEAPGRGLFLPSCKQWGLRSQPDTSTRRTLWVQIVFWTIVQNLLKKNFEQFLKLYFCRFRKHFRWFKIVFLNTIIK